MVSPEHVVLLPVLFVAFPHLNILHLQIGDLGPLLPLVINVDQSQLVEALE